MENVSERNSMLMMFEFYIYLYIHLNGFFFSKTIYACTPILLPFQNLDVDCYSNDRRKITLRASVVLFVLWPFLLISLPMSMHCI